MTIREWFDSEPMRAARMSMFGNIPNTFCSRCYDEEAKASTSRRHRSNQKSVIFTRAAFDESYLQSPGYHKFEKSRVSRGDYDGIPIDIHIDLGNYCNLACKMCSPVASSNIATQYVKWGIKEAEKYLGSDWTRDQQVWSRVLEELASIGGLTNVHFMGGETLITDRFEQFLDFMLDHDRTDLNISFVTNGTVWRSGIMQKLAKFQRVGIEVSIETLTPHNEYQRQGTDNRVVQENLQKFQQWCDGSKITVALRPAISLLTVGYYHTLLRLCLERNWVIKSLLVTKPRYLDIAILPRDVKHYYLQIYQDFYQTHGFDSVDITQDFNESDPNQINKIVKNQLHQLINLLQTDAPDDSQYQLQLMVQWCRRWDQKYKLDARQLYPEFAAILTEHGY